MITGPSDIVIRVTHPYHTRSFTIGALTFGVELLQSRTTTDWDPPYKQLWTVKCNELASAPSNGFVGPAHHATGNSQAESIDNLIAKLYKILDEDA